MSKNSSRRALLVRPILAAVEAVERRVLLHAEFAAAVNYTVGTDPQDIAIVDVNADTKLDLVVANQNTLNISVLLGNGDGTFGAKTDFAAPDNPSSLAVGDVNGDTLPDVVLGIFGDKVAVMLNAGNGTFGAGTAYNAGNDVEDVSLADMNGDTKLDIVSSGPIGDTLTDGYFGVMLNDGFGAFGAITPFTVDGDSAGNAVGDLNGDSVLDVVTANRAANTVTVSLRAANGTVSSRIDYGVADFPYSVALADLTGDGKLDIAVASTNTSGSIGKVSVLKNTGDGTYSPATGFDGGHFSQFVTTGNFDGDSDVDVVAVNPSSDNVSVLLNGGTGTLGAATNFDTGDQPSAAAVADLNGDGKPDIVTTNVASDNISVLINTGDEHDGGSTGVPDLVPSFGKITLPSVFVPGDKASVSVVLTNAGDTKATGHVNVTLYASLDGTLDDNDVLLDTGSTLSNKAISIAGDGKTKTLTGKFTADTTLVPGTYFLIAGIDSTDITENLANNGVVTTDTFQSTQTFGAVGTRKNVKYSYADADGTTVAWSLAGPGTGTVTFLGGVASVVVDGATGKSKVVVTTKGGTGDGENETDVNDFTVNGDVASIAGKGLNILNSLTVNGSVKTVTLEDVRGQTQDVAIAFNGSAVVSLTADDIVDATITSSAPIKSLKFDGWDAVSFGTDTITAPWIGAISGVENLGARLTLSGANAPRETALSSVKLGGGVLANWVIGGNVGTIDAKGSVVDGWVGNISGTLKTLKVGVDFLGDLAAEAITTFTVGGNVTGAFVLAGANFGADNTLGTVDDSYAVGTIKVISIKGAVTTSIFAAGLNVLNSTTIGDADDALLDGGKISSITAKGAVDASSRFLAAALPRTAKLGGVTLVTEIDEHFSLLNA